MKSFGHTMQDLRFIKGTELFLDESSGAVMLIVSPGHCKPGGEAPPLLNHDPAIDLEKLLAESRARGEPMMDLPNGFKVGSMTQEEREEIEDTLKTGRLPARLFPKYPPAEVATLAKYFFRREGTCDGQSATETIGFQTHDELIQYLIATEESEARADKLSYLLGPRAAEQPDSPTLREASK